MSNDIEVTENTLTADDLNLVKEALLQQQKVLSRRNIPGPILFQVVQGKLSQSLDVNLFRRALALSVASNKLPGIDSFAGRVGGFGPVKEKESNVTVSNPLPVVPIVSTPMVIPVVVEIPREEAPAIVNPPAAPIAGSVKEEEEEEEEEEEAVSLFSVLTKVVEAVPVAATKSVTSAPVILIGNLVWNKDKAKSFILGFAIATGPGTQEYNLLRAKAETASVSADSTRAIIRTALGFDPAKVSPVILQWQNLFDSAEEKSEEKKSA